MIKAVLFDFGGVLSEAGKAGSIRRVFDILYGLDLASLNIDDISEKMWRGQISDEAFMAEIGRRHPELKLATVADFQSQLGVMERSEPVYRLAEELRALGIKTGVLSNVFGIGVGPLRAGGYYDGFDPVILSCEVGLAKPETAIYELAARELGVANREIIFIDDQWPWLEPAGTLGMHMVLAKHPAQIVRDTKAIIAAEMNQ